MKAIILAAGFGTRLYPLTENSPKALLRLGKKTILDHMMEKLEVLSPVKEVILVTNSRFYLDFHKWKKNSAYKKPIYLLENNVFIPEKKRGILGDLLFALRSGFCGSDDFLVLSASNYFNFPLGFMLLPALGHRESVFAGVYDVKDKARAREYVRVELDEHHKITRFEENIDQDSQTAKVSIGVYFFPGNYRLRIYEYIEIEKRDPDKFWDFMAWLAGKEPICGIEFDGTWFDIRTLESYEAAHSFLRRKPGSIKNTNFRTPCGKLSPLRAIKASGGFKN